MIVCCWLLIIDYCLLIGECLYYKIRKDKLIGEAQLTKIRNGEIASKETLNTICKLLSCQPGDILEYIESDTE